MFKEKILELLNSVKPRSSVTIIVNGQIAGKLKQVIIDPKKESILLNFDKYKE